MKTRSEAGPATTRGRTSVCERKARIKDLGWQEARQNQQQREDDKGSLTVQGRAIRVDYESLGVVCFKCGKYSHIREACKEGVIASQEESDMPDIVEK
ncbi:hypothetical protein ACOSP7_030942 [Xanthoceras sorbifolium]